MSDFRMSESDIERFEAKYIPEPMSGCWLWTASTCQDGYGKFYLAGRPRVATHVSLAMKLGRWPSGFALHSCDNPCCVNPDHLREGTAADNSADCYRRGRAAAGSRSVKAKLTEAQVVEIRRLVASGERTQRELAREHGIAESCVSLIVRGKKWKSAGGELMPEAGTHWAHRVSRAAT